MSTYAGFGFVLLDPRPATRRVPPPIAGTRPTVDAASAAPRRAVRVTFTYVGGDVTVISYTRKPPKPTVVTGDQREVAPVQEAAQVDEAIRRRVFDQREVAPVQEAAQVDEAIQRRVSQVASHARVQRRLRDGAWAGLRSVFHLDFHRPRRQSLEESLGRALSDISLARDQVIDTRHRAPLPRHRHR